MTLTATLRRALGPGLSARSDANGHEMPPPYMAYRKPVAERIAMCYEQKKDLSKALEWVEAACDKPPARNRWALAGGGLTTCMLEDHCWKICRADEALKSVEPMLSTPLAIENVRISAR